MSDIVEVINANQWMVYPEYTELLDTPVHVGRSEEREDSMQGGHVESSCVHIIYYCYKLCYT